MLRTRTSGSRAGSVWLALAAAVAAVVLLFQLTAVLADAVARGERRLTQPQRGSGADHDAGSVVNRLTERLPARAAVAAQTSAARRNDSTPRGI